MGSYTEERPWGKFHVIDESEGCKIKRIVVNPDGKLSLQSHKQREEHWIVIKGKAKVSVEDQVSFYAKGEYIFIPLGAKHRLENLTEEIVEIVEVQCGEYLGEDDIIRYDDIYSRV
jgi:mannose-1-phosphate guanylyltransferase/mannose-6-phosphate isomerase